MLWEVRGRYLLKFMFFFDFFGKKKIVYASRTRRGQTGGLRTAVVFVDPWARILSKTPHGDTPPPPFLWVSLVGAFRFADA